VCTTVQQNQVDIEKSFKVMSHGQRTISHSDVRKVLKLIGSNNLEEPEVDIIFVYTENEERKIDWKELAIKIKNADVIKTTYSLDHWINTAWTKRNGYESLSYYAELLSKLQDQ